MKNENETQVVRLITCQQMSLLKGITLPTLSLQLLGCEKQDGGEEEKGGGKD